MSTASEPQPDHLYPMPIAFNRLRVGDWVTSFVNGANNFASDDLSGWGPAFGRVIRVGRGHPGFKDDVYVVTVRMTYESGNVEVQEFTGKPGQFNCTYDVGYAALNRPAILLKMPSLENGYKWNTDTRETK